MYYISYIIYYILYIIYYILYYMKYISINALKFLLLSILLCHLKA